jgi:hypothetical protein
VLWQALQPLREQRPDADTSSSSSASSSNISSAVQALKRGAALTTAVAACTTAAAAKLSLPVFIVQLSYKQGIELLTPGKSYTDYTATVCVHAYLCSVYTAVCLPVVCVDASARAICTLFIHHCMRHIMTFGTAEVHYR